MITAVKMKTKVCSFLIGLLSAFVLPETYAIDSRIDSNVQNEINKRLHVPGSIGGNITLTSNTSIGSGGYSFVLSGKTSDGVSVAVKVTPVAYVESHTQEYECYEKMNATTNKICEKYGIPFIYHAGDFLNHKTMAMTMLDETIESLKRRIGSLSKDSILIIFRDMIKTLKFMHSKGIASQDIKADNIMTKGANVFLFDFNECVDSKTQNRRLAKVWYQDTAEDYDMLLLLTTMSNLSNMRMNCDTKKILKSGNEISEEKLRMKKELFKKGVKFIELVEPYVEFCFEIVDAIQEKRLPKYDYLYKMFDDLLYFGRNRSKRIVFKWLTPEQRAAAQMENVSSIDSIAFPKEYYY